ncbi:acyl-CoA desaturase [Paenarthrobacter sp. OM7]|uniref:fatty acid desaturase family protein n=1 Tax=Paenarthrobacter sp. OM7 TaxID=3041264 RepID=UPI0024686EE4|nr:acyl-CoA desaturase [Paenarthrobacter sp. OM7]WGM22446.1 acyl-CoA desaturase [Paenarthrobacter sp. OM7]
MSFVSTLVLLPQTSAVHSEHTRGGNILSLIKEPPPVVPTVKPAARQTTSAIRINKVTSSYASLLTSVKEAGLLERCRRYYILLLMLLIIAGAGVWGAFFLLGDSWLQLAVAAALGVVFTQFALVGHEAGHLQVFATRAANEWTARLIATLMVGMSYAYWTDKHSRHHARPNVVNRDPDIAPGAIVFHNEVANNRGRFSRAFGKRQGYLLFPLLLFLGWTLHVDSLRYLLRRGPVKFRWFELGLLGLRFGTYIGLLFLTLSPGIAAAFIGVQVAVFGLYMGGTFAPNHKGMPILPENSRADFLTRQVLTSRNITGSRFVTFFMGGLNYQIEHHLFPDMPRQHLREASQLVKEHCVLMGIPYTETRLMHSYGIVIRYLNTVGLAAADPFTCPLAGEHRS